jgi:long-chain acyl-CoA synthetase
VPDEVQAKKWAETKGKSGDDFTSLCQDDDLKTFPTPSVCQLPQTNVAYILEEITALSNEKGLFGFEIPKDITLCSEKLTPESDLLTPTFKIKRNVAAKHFSEDIDRRES